MEHEVVLKVTTTGSAGSASGSATTDNPVRGYIEAVQLDYDAAAPATSDLTIVEGSGMARTLFTFTNNATDKLFYPRLLLQDTAGANLTAIYGRIYIAGQKLTAALAQCDALAPAIVIRIHLSEH